jgi:hypothetical protein
VKDTLVVGQDDDRIRLKEQNEAAFADLMMSIDTLTPAGMVVFYQAMASKTVDHPDGHAGNAFGRIKGKFAPDTRPTLTKLHRDFFGAAMKSGHDPDIWITKMESKRVQMETMEFTMTDN